jgi:hypothetical protein
VKNDRWVWELATCEVLIEGDDGEVNARPALTKRITRTVGRPAQYWGMFVRTPIEEAPHARFHALTLAILIAGVYLFPRRRMMFLFTRELKKGISKV